MNKIFSDTVVWPKSCKSCCKVEFDDYYDVRAAKHDVKNPKSSILRNSELISDFREEKCPKNPKENQIGYEKCDRKLTWYNNIIMNIIGYITGT